MNTVSEVVEAALAVLASRPSVLVTDVDGTLSRIVARPQDAAVTENARHSLRRLVTALDRIAVITGREEPVARRMVAVEGLTYIGSYAIDAPGSISFASVEPALVVAEPQLVDLPCVELERKEVSFALHYRNCSEPEATRARLLDLLTPLAAATGTRLMEGKQVIEVAPSALPDKGTALARLLTENRLQGAVFVGDDLADAEAFRVISGRRELLGTPGLCVAVVDDETPFGVRAAADVALDGVSDVERFLEQLANRLEA